MCVCVYGQRERDQLASSISILKKKIIILWRLDLHQLKLDSVKYGLDVNNLLNTKLL